MYLFLGIITSYKLYSQIYIMFITFKS